MDDFLQRLRGTYGDVSIGAVISRGTSLPPAKVPVKAKSPLPPLRTSPPKESSNESRVSDDLADMTNPYEQESTPPKIFPPTYKLRFINATKPQPKKTPSLFPVNIATTGDWIRLREEVMDVHELINFFAGKLDAQSPKFRNILDAYRNALEKSLSIPSEIDGDSSANFVDKLADVIKKRFFTILKSYNKGILGKGEQSPEYYRQLENRVKQYFERIGLKSDNVKRFSDFHLSQDRMNPTPIPAPNRLCDEKIAEVLVQPHYFEYHDDDGEIRKRWIDGECIVYKS